MDGFSCPRTPEHELGLPGADHPGRATGQILGGLLIGGAAGKLLKGTRAGEKPDPAAPKLPPVKAALHEYFDQSAPPKASDLARYAESKGWTKQQTPNGPPKYVDENGIIRMTLKEGSGRAPGSENPHVELRNEDGSASTRTATRSPGKAWETAHRSPGTTKHMTNYPDIPDL